MYKEKLYVSAGGAKDIEFLYFKYSGRDFDLKRECDAVLSLVCPDKLRYIHTQKFLLDFTSFWLQFAQLYTYYVEAKEAREGKILLVSSIQSHGFRLKLTCDLSRSSLIIPEFSLSCKGLLIESESVRINNYFRFANSEESSKFYDTVEDEFVCLQDVTEIRMVDSCLSTCRINMKDDQLTINKI
uniref:Uncharacterized protein n=1 Tax=Romanomermis culicivorax TaxID=13658 RepID=A0A915HZH2_ROMCU